MHHQLYLETAVPQLVLDPLGDRVVEANLEACHLLRRDRQTLCNCRGSHLFAGSLPALVVFTEEIMANTRGHTDLLRIDIDGEQRAVESSGRLGERVYGTSGSVWFVILLDDVTVHFPEICSLQ